MKSYKPLFLFMLSLSSISLAAKAEDPATPAPPSAAEIADQKSYEELLKHLRPIISVDELKKSNFDFSASGGQGKMDPDREKSSCPKNVQLKVFGPLATMTSKSFDEQYETQVITQESLTLPKKLEDFPASLVIAAKDDQGRLVIITPDGIAYFTLGPSSVLMQQAFMGKGVLPVPKPGSGCILSLDNSKSDASVKSEQVAAKLPGRHLAVIDNDPLTAGVDHDAH